jgi:hypothetical protein
MRVAACLVTRGDVDLTEIIESLPPEWEVVIWDNSKQDDLAVAGRYAAIEMTDAELIYVQDDDCVLHGEAFDVLRSAHQPGVLTANMPARFRHDFYVDHCLVGFGAIFERDLPQRAFRKLVETPVASDHFMRTCDIVFTALTTRHLVDVAHRDLPWSNAPDRMWKQPGHVKERAAMLELALAAR